MQVDVYTDGSCHNKCEFGVGAWAFVAVDPEDEQKLIDFRVGVTYEATSNLMEMEAVEEALSRVSKLEGLTKLRIHSDSAYVVNCFLERWFDRWEDHLYIGVKNAEQWQRLIELYRKVKRNKIRVEFVKVKGHSGIQYNELVDKLSGEERYNEISKITKRTKYQNSGREEALRRLKDAEKFFTFNK